MKISLNLKVLCLFLLAGCMFSSCKFSYSFTTKSTLDYTKVSSISIKDFPNMASYVYAPLSQNFTEELKDKFTRQTKLRVLREGGDLDLEGEIVGCDFTPMAVREDAYASQTRFTITVRVRFTNNTNPEDDFEQSFSAYQEFSNTNTIDQVQDELSEIILKEIVDNIFNETVAKW